MNRYPALDFLRKVEIWQHAPGGTAGLAVALPDNEKATLANLLTQVHGLGPSTRLENQARYWLIGYRETNPPLTSEQRAELDGLIAGFAFAPVKVPVDRKIAGRQLLRLWLLLLGVILAVAAGLAGAKALAGSGNGSPPAAGAPDRPPAGPQAGPLTDLQRFRADWGIPAAASATSGHAGQLVLLADGLYYPSPWSIPAADSGWVADTSGTVAGRPAVHGDLADITDSDGTTWTVTVGQPFALAANPQVVLRVLRDATVQSMPQPHAIAVRKHTATGR